MGVAHNFRCSNCHYRLDGMISGYSCGMLSHAHAVLCVDCEALRRCVLPGHPWELRDAIGETRTAAVLEQYGLTCPVAPSHRVSPWSHPGPCPRCGETLDAELDVLLWD